MNPEDVHKEKKVIEIQSRIRESLQETLKSGNAETLRVLATEYPIFAKGWLAEEVSRFPEDRQALLKSIINQLIEETRQTRKVVTIIPVGGRGSRFGPFSWAMLKPFCPLFGESNLISTLKRAIETGRAPEDIFFFIEKEMIEPAKEEIEKAGINLPDENFIPEKHGILAGKKIALEKAAMFSMASIYISKLRGEDTVIVTERTDLVLKGRTPEEHDEIMRELGKAIDRCTTIAALEPTIGILGNPPLPQEKDTIINKGAIADSNKGYILPYPKKKVDPIVEGIMSVSKFHEKPKRGEGDTPAETGEEMARRYIREGATYNGSYFIFRADHLLDLLAIIRPEDHKRLMQLKRCIGREDEAEITEEVYDYFCSDSNQGLEERKIFQSFERAIMQKVAPIKGDAVPQTGVAVSSVGLGAARNWVGSQGTLKAVWPQEKVRDNAIRAEAYGTAQDAIRSRAVEIGSGVKGCHILLAPTDRATQIHVFGAKDLAIAYEHKKSALIVVPVSRAEAVESITRTVKANVQTSGFAEPGNAIPSQERKTVETIKEGDNIIKLGNNGFGVILNSEKSTVYCEEGIVGAAGLSDTTIIKTVEDGIENIYVYGPGAKEAAGMKLDDILYGTVRDELVYVFDRDDTVAKANNPLNRPIPDMPRILGLCIMGGTRVCIASAKSLNERDQLMRRDNDLIREALRELNSNKVDKQMERFNLYLDKTSTRYVNHGGVLVADKEYHVGINPDQATTIKKILGEELGIPENRIIDYPGSIEEQFKLTDDWGHLGHAVVYYHPEFGDVVKFLVKPYGWSEDEYRFESDPIDDRVNPSGRKTRVELAELLTRGLREAGLEGFYAEKGGSVALDITATDKSRVIKDLYDRGYRRIKYYGDDRYGSDKAVFGMAEDINTAGRFPGLKLEAILVKGPEDTYCKVLLERFYLLKGEDKLTGDITDEFAGQAARIFLSYYSDKGEILRDAIELLTAIATLNDSGLSKPGIRELFGSVVEELNNTFTLKNRLTYYKVFAQVIEYCRHLPEGEALNEALNRFGLADEAALLARTMRIRKPKPIDALQRSKVNKVFILSRITIGADIAITSMAFEKMMRLFPDAEIIFLGPSQSRPLFSGNPRISYKSVNYERKGNLIGRFNTWLNLLEVIEEQGHDNDSYIIIDADTRLSQVGLLPFTAGDRGYFFYEADIDKDKLLAEHFSDWLNKTFVEEGESALYPSLYPEDKDLSLAKELFRKFSLEDKYVIGVHLGTGGVSSKAVSIPFETELIHSLIREGATVMLYKGVNAKEEERTDRIIGALKKEDISISEIREDEIEGLDSSAAQIIVFSRTGIALSAAILGKCQQVVSYSSSSKHIAGAMKVPVTVIYVREASFVDRWVPYTTSSVDVVRITPEEKPDESGVLSRVMASVKSLGNR